MAMKQKEKLPSFFVVGAQKAGTTTLHDWLVQQPDVCLPAIKETTFFSYEKVYTYGIEWYLRQFPKCADDAVKGEICPEYLFFKETPYRIREWIKIPKIIFILRNPLDRAYSHYQMTVRRGYESLSFKDALLAEKERLRDNDHFNKIHFSYMARSRYCEQINRYREAYPTSGFLFVSFDDLIGNATSAETYERICTFIGIRSSPAIADRTVLGNPASLPRSLLLNRLLYFKPGSLQHRIMKRILSPLSIDFLVRVKYRLECLNQKPIKKDEKSRTEQISVPVSNYVEAVNEITALEQLTGLSLGYWTARMEKKYLME